MSRATARVRTQHGVAAVEAALVLGFFIMPLLLGVLQLGDMLWRAQRVGTYSARLPVGSVTGTFTCAELVARVSSTVQDNLSRLGTPVPAQNVVVKVLEVTPPVGATVQVSVQAPVAGAVVSLLPLPNGGPLVTEFTTRLDDVVVTSSSCL